MCYGFQAVVDVERRDHHKKSVGVHGADERGDDERVPRLVCVVNERVDSVGEKERDGDHV